MYMIDNRLYRDKANGIIGGVAAGIGSYLKLDTTLVRIVFIILVFFGRTGVFSSFLIYCILWAAIPPMAIKVTSGATPFDADYRIDPINDLDKNKSSNTRSPSESSRVLGFILVALGVIFLANRFITIDWDIDRFWPVILILVGIVLVIKSRKQKDGHHSSPNDIPKTENQAGTSIQPDHPLT